MYIASTSTDVASPAMSCETTWANPAITPSKTPTMRIELTASTINVPTACTSASSCVREIRASPPRAFSNAAT